MSLSTNPPPPPKRKARIAAGALLLLALLLGSAAPQALAQGGGLDDTPQTPGQVGAPVLAQGGAAFEGTYMSGELPSSGAVVANFTRQGARLFDAVQVSGYVRTESSVQGGRVEAKGEGVRLEILDALAGYLEVELAPGRSLTVVPAAGVSFEDAGGGSVDVRAEGLDGVLFTAGPGAGFGIEGGRAVLGAASQPTEVYFRAATEADVLAYSDLDDAMAMGNLGAEVSVGAQGPQAPVTRVTYGDLEVNVTLDDSRLTVGVAAGSPEGKSIFILIPRSSVEASDSVIATFDGQPLGRASSSADALNATDDGGQAEFFMTSSGNLTALVLSVPHFSVHLFALSVIPPARNPTLTPAGIPLGEAALPLLLGAVVAAGAAAALWRRPEQ